MPIDLLGIGHIKRITTRRNYYDYYTPFCYIYIYIQLAGYIVSIYIL